MVTAPLGLVPRELEDLWPAAHYDIPVTGDWDEDELNIIRSMVSNLVERVGYKDVINHSGLEIKVDGANVHDTRMGDSAGSVQSLSRLELTTNNLASSLGLEDCRRRP
jgi:archaeosine synthase